MIDRPRGTRDLGPEEMEIRRKVEKNLRNVCKNFGYREVLTPTFEHTELFLKRSGPSIVEEIYAFEDKGGREIALRPELTAPVMRMYADSLREEPKPLKLFYFGPAFRYERPQSGRYREFWHFGSELIGPDTPEADAENIALAYSCLKDIGLEDFELRISNLRILESYLQKEGLSKEERKEVYHKLDKEELNEVKDKFRLDDIESILDSSVEELRDFIAEEPVDYLEDVLKTLEKYDITEDEYDVDLKTVRGLDYYKGIVFEIDAPNLGAEKQICGGGDYDLGDIFEVEISSKGFAIGFDRMLLALKEEKKTPELEEPRCYIIPIGEESFDYSYDVLNELRDDDIKGDIEMMGRGVGKALSYANKRGFSYSILIGEDEVDAGTVSIKHMKSGDQKTIDREDLLKEVETVED